jgi:hypothetical protein
LVLLLSEEQHMGKHVERAATVQSPFVWMPATHTHIYRHTSPYMPQTGARTHHTHTHTRVCDDDATAHVRTTTRHAQ